MSANKVTKVSLVNSNKDVGGLELEISHAERLLLMSSNGGWKLPKDSDYKLGKNGIIKKSNKGTTTKAD